MAFRDYLQLEVYFIAQSKYEKFLKFFSEYEIESFEKKLQDKIKTIDFVKIYEIDISRNQKTFYFYEDSVRRANSILQKFWPCQKNVKNKVFDEFFTNFKLLIESLRLDIGEINYNYIKNSHFKFYLQKITELDDLINVDFFNNYVKNYLKEDSFEYDETRPHQKFFKYLQSSIENGSLFFYGYNLSEYNFPKVFEDILEKKEVVITKLKKNDLLLSYILNIIFCMKGLNKISEKEIKHPENARIYQKFLPYTTQYKIDFIKNIIFTWFVFLKKAKDENTSEDETLKKIKEINDEFFNYFKYAIKDIEFITEEVFNETDKIT